MDLALGDITLVLGELGEFLDGSDWGLTCRPDGIHFDSKSCREFGARYFQEYLKIMASADPAGARPQPGEIDKFLPAV